MYSKLNLNLLFQSKVKSLGAGDSDGDDDSAMSWVNKSRKTEREKAMAEKRVSLQDHSTCVCFPVEMVDSNTVI